MNSLLKKIFAILALPALAAGIIFMCGFARRLPQGTTVNGVSVGGMTECAAIRAVRADIAADLNGRELKICSPANVYAFSYPEISFRDNLKTVVAHIRRGGQYLARAEYFLNGLDCIVSAICEDEYAAVREPEAIFNGGEGEAFEYVEESDGLVANPKALKAGILASLAERRYGGDFAEVTLSVRRISPKGSLAAVKERTARLSAYTTYFDGENLPRAGNIRLAGQKISGCVLGAGEVFSFNGRVGPRTEENGFLPAKIISGRKYVYGAGGGVCQVSTTLYNAALLAGLEVTEYHPHSLAVGYVGPSRDAMVSGNYCDLKFANCTGSPVYIRVLTGKSFVRCEIYGLWDGASYSLSSRSREGEDGLESECYLTVTRGEDSVTRLLRRDRYLTEMKDAEEDVRDEAVRQPAV